MSSLIDMLKRHEGKRLRPYHCTAGKLTIGYGRNLEDLGISEEEAEYLLQNDVKRVENECIHAFPWFADLTERRRWVLIDMCFNLGFGRLRKFEKFLKAMELEDYETAANEMLDSLWARQVKSRALELAQMIREG